MEGLGETTAQLSKELCAFTSGSAAPTASRRDNTEHKPNRVHLRLRPFPKAFPHRQLLFPSPSLFQPPFIKGHYFPNQLFLGIASAFKIKVAGFFFPIGFEVYCGFGVGGEEWIAVETH